MRILLTGAAGFVGSHLTDRLIAEGHHVIGVDNLSTGNHTNVSHLRDNPQFHFVQHDVVEPLDLPGSLDWVMHFASPASPPHYQRLAIETLRVNAEGTYHLLQLARRKGAKFFLASTSEVYGDPLVHPQPESYWGNVNPIGPRGVYDEAKRYAEALVMAHRRQFGTDIRIVRIFNTYGPRMDRADGRVISNFISQALTGQPLTVYGNGSQTRSFQFVDDLIEGIVRLMNYPMSDPVNLGNPEESTVLQLARLVIRISRTSSPVVFCPLPADDPQRRRPDITKARILLNWEPVVTLEDGLRRTMKYFTDRLAASRA